MLLSQFRSDHCVQDLLHCVIKANLNLSVKVFSQKSQKSVWTSLRSEEAFRIRDETSSRKLVEVQTLFLRAFNLNLDKVIGRQIWLMRQVSVDFSMYCVPAHNSTNHTSGGFYQMFSVTCLRSFQENTMLTVDIKVGSVWHRCRWWLRSEWNLHWLKNSDHAESRQRWREDWKNLKTAKSFDFYGQWQN